MHDAPSGHGLNVPVDLTKPSRTYRRQAWIVMLGLILFMALYIAIACWFTYTAYRLILGVFAGGDGAVLGFFAALPAAFLAVFMWKALFFIRTGSETPGVEINADDQPALFEFLYSLADEIGAPRPHRVFLAPNVNASVFYDLSILNLILPSKKNLVIGLGLVNCLGRTEFKAVLAHEFGHFAQRSMAVGRWVYVGQQIAGHIIAKRDALDSMLNFISVVDLRVAWIGWIMRLVVWSIRSTMETLFSFVVMAHRALSRQMEFHADLVAVSVTGSDALVHALYKLQPADEDWERTIDFANAQLAEGKIVTDLYAIQTNMGVMMRTVLNEPTHGVVPPIPVSNPAEHRLFTQQLAQPPQMWSTHPANNLREQNAKQVYLSSTLDDTSAWRLFRDPTGLREQQTGKIFESVKFVQPPAKLTNQEALEILDQQFGRESLASRYHGAYLNRPITLASNSIAGLYEEPTPREEIISELDSLYPEALSDAISEWRTLSEEASHLQAMQDGFLESSGKYIHYRGDQFPRTQLASLTERVQGERDTALHRIESHDRICRTVHQTAARYVALGWQEFIDSLLKLLHYAEHSEADLRDAYEQLANVTNMAIASRSIGAGKRKRVLDAADDLHAVMRRLNREAKHVELPAEMLAELGTTSWQEFQDELKLPPPNPEQLAEWLEVIDSWAHPMTERFSRLRALATEALLVNENKIDQLYRGALDPYQAPKPIGVPSDYRTRARGSERKRQKKLDLWSRFTSADGVGPAVARFAVATTILVAVLAAGMFVGTATVIAHNGLSIPVVVAISGRKLTVPPHADRKLSVGATFHGTVTSTDQSDRLIESFDVSMDRGFATYVYNVGGASPLVKWFAAYGNIGQPQPQVIGFRRWGTSSANHKFEAPPRQVKTKGQGVVRSILEAYPDLHPQQMYEMSQSQEEKENLIRMHAKWDAPHSPYMEYWLSEASDLVDAMEILAHRLDQNPTEIVTLRFQQDEIDGKDRAAILAQHRQQAMAHPDNPDWQYIGVRAMEPGQEKEAAYLAGHQRWPEHQWFASSAGFVMAGQKQWSQALDTFSVPLGQRGELYRRSAIVIARIRRLLATEAPADLSDVSDCIEIQSMMALESDQALSPGVGRVYQLLYQGDVEQAYQLAQPLKDELPRMLVLLAASEQAPESWLDDLWKFQEDQFESPEILMYLAVLAQQNDRPTDPYLTELEKIYQHSDSSPMPAIHAVLNGDSPEQVEEATHGLSPRLLGAVFAAHQIMLPESTPARWESAASKLLFPPERPYFLDD